LLLILIINIESDLETQEPENFNLMAEGSLATNNANAKLGRSKNDDVTASDSFEEGMAPKKSTNDEMTPKPQKETEVKPSME